MAIGSYRHHAVKDIYARTVIQGRRNRSGQSGHGLTSFGSSVLKIILAKKCMNWKVLYLCFNLVLASFVYLTVQHLSIHNTTDSMSLINGSREHPN